MYMSQVRILFTQVFMYWSTYLSTWSNIDLYIVKWFFGEIIEWEVILHSKERRLLLREYHFNATGQFCR